MGTNMQDIQFLSTLSLRRATSTTYREIFDSILFLSTLSLRRATAICMMLRLRLSDFYPRSPCGERRIPDGQNAAGTPYFYPRSPCGERQSSGQTLDLMAGFLSTLSLRRATMRHRLIELWKLNFYPRSPCGERQAGTHAQWPTQQISIHALLAESDRVNQFRAKPKHISIHALLAESDVWPGLLARPFFIISIHALLAESDLFFGRDAPKSRHFYPRSPCGERQT